MAFQYLNNRPLDEARTQYLALLQEQGLPLGRKPFRFSLPEDG